MNIKDAQGGFGVSLSNVGSWSMKEELPQEIIEYKASFTMFQIESNQSTHLRPDYHRAGKKMLSD